MDSDCQDIRYLVRTNPNAVTDCITPNSHQTQVKHETRPALRDAFIAVEEVKMFVLTPHFEGGHCLAVKRRLVFKREISYIANGTWRIYGAATCFSWAKDLVTSAPPRFDSSAIRQHDSDGHSTCKHLLPHFFTLSQEPAVSFPIPPSASYRAH